MYSDPHALKLLVEDRRARHTALANKGRSKREFAPGDLVVVRRQVTSDASKGRPAKLRVRARGPYRVLEKAGEESYWIQRVPILQELNRRPGKKQKQAAWRLERIPSSVVVHKQLDSADARWVQRTATLKDNPLEHNLGFFDFGRYHKAAEDSKHAFEKVGELMGFEVDTDGEDSEDENDDDDESDEIKDATQQSENKSQPSSAASQAWLQVTAGKKVDSTCPLTPATRRKNLARDVSKSKDKLFFIRRLRP